MLIVILRTLILYTTVVFCLRIMGKRQIGELQPSELVVAIMISDVATVPIEGLDVPLLSGIIPVLTLLLAEVITSYISLKSHRFRRFIMGDTRKDSIHGHHQMVNTKIRLIIFSAAKDGEALYSQQKQDQELTVAQTMNSLLPNSDLN